MAEMKYDLYTAPARLQEINQRLTTLEQRHHMLKLDKETGITMNDTGPSMVIGGVVVAPVSETGEQYDPEKARDEEITKLENAITTLREKKKALESEINS